MKYSIIIPVYKVEPFLRKCIESVLSQKCQDFELILVDDGSPDNCPKLCDDFAEQHLNIKVIHKVNGGLSSARNAGLDNAKGEYIIFLDSDDYWCDESLLSDLSERIDKWNEDAILFGLKILKVGGEEEPTRGDYNLEIINQHDKDRTLNYLFNTNQFPGSSCIICTKRKMIAENFLNFKVGVTAEDFEWAISVLICSNSIGAINGVQYVYVRREGSITTSSKLSGIKGTVNAIRYYRDSGYNNQGVAKFLSRIFLLSVMSYNNLPNTDKKDAKELLNQYSNILMTSGQKAYYLFIRIFGYKITSCVIRTIYKIIR